MWVTDETRLHEFGILCYRHFQIQFFISLIFITVCLFWTKLNGVLLYSNMFLSAWKILFRLLETSKIESPRPGIEPGPSTWQAEILTTRLSRITCSFIPRFFFIDDLRRCLLIRPNTITPTLRKSGSIFV